MEIFVNFRVEETERVIGLSKEHPFEGICLFSLRAREDYSVLEEYTGLTLSEILAKRSEDLGMQ